MSHFEIRQVNEVSLAADRSLHRDEICQRADRCLNAVDTSGIGRSRSTSRGELGGLETQRNALRKQLVGIARCVPDEAVSTPFLTRAGIIAAGLRVTSASAGFHQSIC